MAVRLNVVANVAGSGWSAIIGLAFIPIYIRFLGVEAYGLIGIYATVQAWCALLDAGLTPTLNRELARLAAAGEASLDSRRLVRTLEIVFWMASLLIGLGIVLLAPALAHHWIRPEKISTETVQRALMLMGIAIALQWPAGLYSGGLQGLQQHVRLNVVLAATSSIRAIGAVAILYFVSPTIEAFFIWQTVTAGLQTIAIRTVLWRGLPPARGPVRFHTPDIVRVWQFAAGVGGITILGVLLTQVDTLILSKLLTLEMFSYYALASTAAAGLYRLISPIFSAVFPRLSELVVADDRVAVAAMFHKSSQLLSVATAPAALMLIAFAPEILQLWTRNPAIVANSHLLLTLIAIGTAFHGLSHIPYALQLAYGWTKLQVQTNVVAVCILIPALIVVTGRWGAVGAAALWVALNCGYLVFSVPVMFRRLLPEEKQRWYVHDVLFPVLAAAGPVLAGRLLIRENHSAMGMAGLLIGVGILAQTACAATIPWMRQLGSRWILITSPTAQ